MKIKSARILFLIVLTLSFLVSQMEAQYTKIALREGTIPKAPLIASIPENAEWTLEIYHRLDILKAQRAAKKEKEGGSDPNGERPPPPGSESDVVKVTNLYSNGVQWMESQTRGGFRFSRFIVGNLIAYENPRRNEIVVATPEEMGLEGEVNQAGKFNGFDWVNSGNYRGIAVYRERECDVYQQAQASGQGILRSAFIERRTKLPVGLEDSGSITIYKFLPNGKTLTFPDRYQKALEDYRYESNRLQRRYNIPQ